MVTRSEPHRLCGGHLALDFVNSAGRPAEGAPLERLHSYADLLTWARQAEALTGPQARSLARAARARTRAAEEVRLRAIRLREAVFRTFLADARGEEPCPEDVGTINAELARSLARVRVEPDEEGFAFGFAHEPGDLDAPLWPVARAAAELLVSPEHEWVKECASDECVWLFLDHTKNRKRRWCDMKTCGNREKARRHRERCRGTGKHPKG